MTQDLKLTQIQPNFVALAEALGGSQPEDAQPFVEFAAGVHHLYQQIIQVLYPYLIPSFHPEEEASQDETPTLLEKGEPLEAGIEWGDFSYLGGLLWPFSSELLELLKDYSGLSLYLEDDATQPPLVPQQPLKIEAAEFEISEDKRQLFWQIYVRIEQWRKSLFGLLQSDWSKPQAALPAFLELGRCLHGLLADCFLISAVPLLAARPTGE